MSDRYIEQSIHVQADCKTVFKALVTPSAICAWWKAQRAIVAPAKGGAWVAAWGGHDADPEYVTAATIREFNPGSSLVLDYQSYYVKGEGASVQEGMAAVFDIHRVRNGCRLVVRQTGFGDGPDHDEYYEACVRGWQETLGNLEAFLKTRI